MKIHDWALIFLGIFITYFLVIFISVKTTQAENVKDIRYSDYLTTATEDAISSIHTNGTDLIFGTKENRKKASNIFYDTLSHCLENVVRGESYVQDMVPFIIYVDVNGFYVQYRDFTSSNELATIITPINTWNSSFDNGNYLVRYSLNEDVEVLDRTTGNTYKGNRFDVYNKANTVELYYLTQDTFYEERDYVVLQKIEDAINYYCNNYNYTNPMGYTYEVTLPRTKGTDEGRFIDQPCIISFLQGEWFGLTGTDANIYAFSGAEVTTPVMYGVTDNAGEKLYHTKKCSMYSYIVDTGTIKECAEMGAYPCPDCVR